MGFWSSIQQNSDMIVIIFQIIETVAALGIFAAAWVAYRSYKANRDINARKAALDFSLTKNQEFQRCRSHLLQKFEYNFKEVEKVELDDIDQDQEIKDALRYLLSHWEIMAIAIYRDVIDEEVAFEMTGLTTVKTITIFYNYIERAQKDGNNRIYMHLLLLHEDWQKKLESSGEWNRGPKKAGGKKPV